MESHAHGSAIFRAPLGIMPPGACEADRDDGRSFCGLAGCPTISQTKCKTGGTSLRSTSQRYSSNCFSTSKRWPLLLRCATLPSSGRDRRCFFEAPANSTGVLLWVTMSSGLFLGRRVSSSGHGLLVFDLEPLGQVGVQILRCHAEQLGLGRFACLSSAPRPARATAENSSGNAPVFTSASLASPCASGPPSLCPALLYLNERLSSSADLAACRRQR